MRLWPLSEYKSKNFLDIFGFLPLEATIQRFLKITPRENIFLVANEKEKASFENLKIVKKGNIFFEPESKNTASAILFSLQNLKRHFSLEKTIIISPVDHLIKQEEKFYSSLNKALEVARDGYI